ncbi:hypothetical protein DH2020_010246 [Rehmannia glutinosa]|uniref:tRNA-binding domain-containing protein n=1 Tax=Rehmannia glutinosa TaxID=99300 RepID=A0ABR0X8J9_REHGL
MASVKQNIVSALCKHLSVDPNSFASDLGSDLKSLCTSILKSSENGDAHFSNSELTKWIGFAESFLENSDARFKALTDLNEELITKSVVLGNGLKPSPADVIVFSTVHSSVIGLSSSDRAKLPHLFRWVDYIQNKEEFGGLYEKILLEKVQFVPPVLKPVKKVEDSNAKKTVQEANAKKTVQEANAKNTAQEAKGASSSETDSKGKKSADTNYVFYAVQLLKSMLVEQKKKVEESQAKSEKKKPLEKVADNKEEELSVSLLKIQIGQIRKAWKHPSADSLLVEEIDVGEAKCRQVVSGLAKFCTPEELTNRRVVLITNVKPGKLRDVMSEGLVLCASNKDHTVVEPLLAPDGAKLGEYVTFSGHDGKPEEVLNPKKKQLDKITPHLFSDDKGVATFKGVPFMTSSGPCTSSIPNATIK